MSMKKKIYLFFFAFLLGSTMAYITYKKLKVIPSPSEDSSYFAYQVGIYKEHLNAVAKAEETKGAIIISDKDMYRVVVAITNSNINTSKIEDMLKKEGISYYKKEIVLNEEEKEVVNNYGVMIEQTKDLDSLKLINQKFLQTLQERVK